MFDESNPLFLSLFSAWKLGTLILFVFLLFSSVTLIINEDSTVSAQPVPEYQDASNGLPTADLWTCKLVFFDIDDDGVGDLISLGPRKGDNTKDVHVYKWSGDMWTDASIEEGTNNIPHSSYGGHDLADLDNDGDWDLAVGSHGSDSMDAYLRSFANAWLESSTGLQASRDGFDVDTGDFNSDGYLDLAVGGFWGKDLRVYAGNGQGQWVEQSGDFAPGGASRITAQFVDVNNDGNLDVISNLQGGNWCYLGDGAGGWTNFSEGLPDDSWGWTPDYGDFNNDGYIDLAMCANERVWAFEGDGTGNWTNSSIGLPSSYTFKNLKMGDMNNDGNDDIVGLTYERIVELYLATGAGTWLKADTTSMQGNAESHRINIGDFDHNLHNDITAGFGTDDVAGYPGSIKVWRETTIPAELEVVLDYPNGREYINEGSIQFIRWRSGIPAGSGARTVDLEYSTSGETGPWNAIENDLPDTGIYQWEVPEIPASGECFIRITLSAEVGGPVTDLNDNPFGIGMNPNMNHRPVITEISPDEDDEIVDTEFLIEWNATDSDGDDLSIDLYFDEDEDPENGKRLIVESISDSGEFSWDTSEVDEGTYFIFVRADDGNGKNGTAYSNRTLTIDHNDPPEMEITKPSGDEEEADTSYTITWEANDHDEDELTIDLYYEADGGGRDDPEAIATGLENSGSYVWDCSEIEEGIYRILGEASDGTMSSTNRSSGTISILHDTGGENHAPVIEILEPDGNDDEGDESYAIEWEASDEDDDTLLITLYYDEDRDPDNGQVLIAEELENTGSYTWDTSEVPHDRYYIHGTADDQNGLTGEDHSRGRVRISHMTTSENADPVVTEVSAERIDDQFCAIHWEATDPDEDELTISIYYDDDVDPDNGRTRIVEDRENTGYYEWDVSEMEDGDYYIHVDAEDTEGAVGSGHSDVVTIQHPDEVADFVITFFIVVASSPDPGEDIIMQVKVMNQGGIQGAGTLEFTLDGTAISIQEIDLDPEEERSYTAIWVAVPGNHSFRVQVDHDHDPTPENNLDTTTIVIEDIEGGSGDDDDFPTMLFGIGMIAVLAVITVVIVVSRRKEEGILCQTCGGQTQHSHEEDDDYCWNCEDYVGETE